MHRASAAFVCSALLSIVVLPGCGSVSPESENDTSSSITRSTQGPPIIVIPPPPPTYNAYVGALGCVPVSTPTGAWYGTPTFPGDPSFCTYDWDGGRPGPSSTSLIDGLVARGVLADDITIDATCTNGSCAHPVVAEVPFQGINIGGSVNCVKCVHASVIASNNSLVAGSTATLNVALAPSVVTSYPSRLYAVVDHGIVTFDQPGGVAAFSVGLTSVDGDGSHLAEIPGPGGDVERNGYQYH